MKKFEFKFAAVEKVRKMELDQQAKEMALAQAEVEKLRSEIQSIEANYAREMERMKNMPVSQQIQADIRSIWVNFRENTRKKLKEKNSQLLEAQQNVIREQRKVVQKRKKKMVMEKLREKEEGRYYEELKRVENHEMDEINNNLFTHNRKPERS